MKRTIFYILTILLVVVGSTAPVVAKDNGKNDNKAATEECKKDGWQSLTDEDGDPFKNQGQCVSYAKQGGELVERDDATASARDDDDEDNGDEKDTDDGGDKDDADEPSLELVDGQDPWNGYLVGEGFTPGEEIVSVTFASERETLDVDNPVGTVIEEDGSFQTERIIYWCSEYDGYGETSGVVTVEDSGGVTYSQEFEMDEHCEDTDPES